MKEIQGKSILVRVSARFELMRVRVIGSRLYVSCTSWHLFTRVDGHKSKSSSVREHYDKDHVGAVPEHLLSCFSVLKKCKNKFDCLVNEMLFQRDSIRANVFVQLCSFMQIQSTLTPYFHNLIMVDNQYYFRSFLPSAS